MLLSLSKQNLEAETQVSEMK